MNEIRCSHQFEIIRFPNDNSSFQGFLGGAKWILSYLHEQNSNMLGSRHLSKRVRVDVRAGLKCSPFLPCMFVCAFCSNEMLLWVLRSSWNLRTFSVIRALFGNNSGGQHWVLVETICAARFLAATALCGGTFCPICASRLLQPPSEAPGPQALPGFARIRCLLQDCACATLLKLNRYPGALPACNLRKERLRYSRTNGAKVRASTKRARMRACAVRTFLRHHPLST